MPDDDQRSTPGDITASFSAFAPVYVRLLLRSALRLSFLATFPDARELREARGLKPARCEEDRIA
jgi:hypothetical protein